MELHSFDEVALLVQHRTEQILTAFKTMTKVTLVERTPIKTGMARSGWVESPQGTVTLGEEFSLGNDVPYILKLEYGSSTQAPNGFARITAAESQERLDAAVALVVGG